MVTLTNTTYYPAILLRKRWLEAGAGRGGAFDITAELGRLHTETPLNSLEVSELEQWSTGTAAAHTPRLDTAPIAHETPSARPTTLPGATLRTLRPAPRRERQPVSARPRFHVGRRGGAAVTRMAGV